MSIVNKGSVFLNALLFFISGISLANNFENRIDSLLTKIENAANDSIRARHMVSISLAYTDTEPFLAVQYAENAVKLAEKQNNYLLQLHTLAHAGNMFYRQGLLMEALNHYNWFLDIAKQNNNQRGIAIGYMSLGNIVLSTDEYLVARNYFYDALSIFNQIRNDSENLLIYNNEVATIYNNIGLSYMEVDLLSEALNAFQLGTKEATGISNAQNTHATLLSNTGNVYSLLGLNKEAEDVLLQAVDIFYSIGNKARTTTPYYYLGNHFERLGQEADALNYYYKGFAIAKESNSNIYLKSFSERLSGYYQSVNQADSALKYLLKFQEYQSKINKEETIHEITRIELTAQFKEREAIRILEEERRFLRFIFIGVALTLILIIFVLLYYLSQGRIRRLTLYNQTIQLEKQNSQLQQEKLKKELELRNKELTTNVMSMIRKNEMINDVTQQLIEYSKISDNKNLRIIRQVVYNLSKSKDDSIWNEFEIRFQSVHNNFYTSLQQKFPGLSLNERRLCAFLRLDMTTKEISSITGQSVKSIEMARIRLRKKLDISNTDANLNEFLQLV